MPLNKFVFRPGINREGTDYDNEGGWFDVNLVRFKNGRPQKIGGWAKESPNTYEGTGRALHGWVALSGARYLGLGTTFKYYVQEGNEFNNITPTRKTSTNSITFSATNGSSVITVTDSSHGAVLNDFVTFAQATSLGGNVTASVLNQEYQVASIVNTNSYTIVAKDTDGNTVTANASDSGNGGSGVDAVYQLNVGLDAYAQSTGWGVEPWGSGGFGSASSLSFSNQLRIWTHDNYGEDLMICPRGGPVFRWIENDGTSVVAKNLATTTGAILVPTVGLQVITSEKDRHLIVLGSDPIEGDARSGVVDPMLISFSDQENPLDFEPLSTNTAGSLRLSSGSVIIGGVKSRQEILVWTDTSLYSMQFIGPPFTFGINLISETTGLVAPKAAVSAPNGVFWMGYDNFYAYTGSVKKLPCSVLSYVFDDFNSSQVFKVFGFSNTQFDEVGWFYPSASSSEIDRYVVYNYAENVWTYGELVRHAWLDSGVEPYPRATGAGFIYEHETGYDDDGSPMTNVFIESSDFDIADGEQFAFIKEVIPDFKFLENASGAVNLVLKTRNSPGETLTTNSTSSITGTTSKADVRARGRQAVIRVESDDDNVSGNTATGWRLGATRLDVRPDGRR
tara:strand:+ start:272 stop:2131 length:1860 start_codon:yes stop_codon:yes gene_type:complete